MPAAGGLHEAMLRYERVATSAGDQARIGLALESVWAGGVSSFGLTLGAPQGEATVLRQRIDAGFAWQAFGRDWQLDLWQQRADGGWFLNVPRQDRLQGIGLAVSLQPGTSLRLGVMSSRSTAAIADYQQVTLDLRFGNPFR